MTRTFKAVAFGFALAVLSLNSQIVSERIDQSGQRITAGPHGPVVPMTFN